MQFCSILSGSSGNCLFVRDRNTSILIDCGLSGKATESGLAVHGISIDTIDGVLVTHEHIDHTKGIGVLARKYKKKIYITKKTFSALPASVGNIPENMLCFISNQAFQIGNLNITPFETSHDACDPHGFSVTGEKKICIATDTGIVTSGMTENLCGCDFAFVESNHDLTMLKYGPYSPELKRRILSDFGHLPNTDAAHLSVWLASKGTKRIMLGHLSGENNTEEIALATTKNALSRAGFEDAAANLSVASRVFPSELIEF